MYIFVYIERCEEKVLVLKIIANISMGLFLKA